MKLASCFRRYLRYFALSAACSAITLFINSDMLVNKFRLQIIATAVFIIGLSVDTYIFASYFGKKKHCNYGIYYPYTMFALTSIAAHFFIKSARWKYLFLPLDIMESFGMSRFFSVITVHTIIILIFMLCIYLGRKKFYGKY